MKKLLSYALVLTMIVSLFTVSTVSAAGTAAGSAKIAFIADFDYSNPTPILTDGNVSVVNGDDGNVAQVVWNEVGYGGATYKTNEFSLTGDTVLKFDIKNNGAGHNVIVGLRDKDGKDIIFRLRPGTTAGYVASGKAYTYLVYKPGGSGNAYVGYRKEIGTDVWEDALIEFKRSYPDGSEASTTNNSFRFSWGSSSAGAGSWLLDNVVIYEGTPGISVLVPEDVAKTKEIELYKTTVDDGVTGGTVAGPASKIYPDDDATNMVIDYNCANYEDTYATSGRTETFRTAQIPNMPEAKDGFWVHFDFRRIEDQTNEWIQIVAKAVNDSVNSACIRIPTSQFTKGVWYTVSYKIAGDGTKSYVVADTATVTNKATGQVTKLLQNNSSSWSWTGQTKNINFCLNSMDYNKTTNPSVANRSKIHYQFDNIRCTTDEAQLIKTEMLVKDAAGAEVLPMLAAYNANGILTAVTQGDEAALDAVSTYAGYVNTAYNVAGDAEKFKNAKSVKALYWDNLGNAKAYADAVEIGDAISPAVLADNIVAKEIAVTADMIPAGATGKYTLLAYTVPFPVTENNIPEYDDASYKLVALQQSETAPTSFKIDASLYNGNEQDIVIVCNADGAAAPVVTLYEENKAPTFTNIAMQLGADQTQRNFTWYSLDNSAGKITYQKKSEMIDGGFTDGAIVVEATRCHADNVYSSKEFYYQNQAVITGLEAGEAYVYQLSNGSSKSPMHTITMADDDSTFSFAFSGDPQVGGLDNASYADQMVHFGRTVSQLRNTPELKDVEFFVSGGDQIDSASTVKDIEGQYDIFLNHDQWATFPMATTLGNHDAKPAGLHMQHFNEPNKLINPETGEYYGASPNENPADIDGVDYYYVYNSVLFMHINLNTFDDLSNGTEAARANDKADAEEHIEFIKRVLEETKDNKDILWKVVVSHQSPFGGSYHGNYTKKADGTYSRAEQYDYINIREYLLPFYYEIGVDLVLSGHDHTYTRTHILKPTGVDTNGHYFGSMEITPYEDGSYTYADGTTTPTYVSWTDKAGMVFDGTTNPYIKVKSKPVKVTNPDGFMWITGSSSSGSQVNGAEYPNHYAAVCEKINQRSMIKFDVSPTSIKMTTYNLGTNTEENDPLVVVDEFEIEKTTAVPVKGVALPESETIAAGQTKKLVADLMPAQPTNANVTWASDNNSVATVDANGVVTAVAPGTANITVTTADGGFTATCAVTVVEGVAVTSITLPESVVVEALKTKTLVATIAPDNATTKKLNWTSSDPSKVSVDSNGNVTAYKPGTAEITAMATDGSGVSATCTVTVSFVESVRTLNKSEVTFGVLESDKLTLSFAPANATYQDVSWVTSDANIVEVTNNGEIKAIAPGTATVSAVTEEGSVDCAVTVTGKITFSQNYEDASYTAMTPASTNTVYKRIQDTDGNWVLQVDGSGLTASNKVGTVYTTQLSSVSEREVPAPTSKGDVVVDFDIKNMSTTGHQSFNIRLYTEDQVHYAQRIRFTKFELGEWYDVRYVRKSNGNIIGYYKKWSDAEWTEVTVTSSKTGEVFANGSTISGQIHYGYMAFCPYDTITDSVNSALGTNFYIDNMRVYSPVATEGMTLAESSANLEIGETAKITPVFTPSNATDGHVAYVTSDASVATVDRYGNVTAIGGGTAIITVTAADGGFTAQYTVTVKGVDPEISVTATDNGFKVSTNVAVDGQKVYVAAYDASDRVIAVGMADYAISGADVPIVANASYYKAFIWGTSEKPVISELIFN